MLSEGQIKKVYLSVFLPLFSPRLALQKEFKIVQKFQFKPKTESAFSSLHVKKTIGKGGFAPPRRYQISPQTRDLHNEVGPTCGFTRPNISASR